jgi:methylated-DNA-[protein]-cysteine S-methyltransferase
LTYGQLAARIGQPAAARAVGGALGRNPFVLLVPCHRVVAAAAGTRRLCGFTGGVDLKAWLLNFESSSVSPSGE